MRKVWVATVAAMLLYGSAHADFGDPLPNVSGPELDRFTDGRAEFSTVETVADGLGPVFNESACVACHFGPGSAVGGNTARIETRFGTVINGAFDALVQLGGSLLQDQGIGRGDATAALPNRNACKAPFSFVGETVPATATVVAKRRTTPLFGLGLVDATPDNTFRQLAAAEQSANPATAGVVSLVTNPDTGQSGVVGRFGWKAQVATLHAFAGDAYLNEMGVTNPSFPDENCPNGDCSQLVCNPVPALNDDGGDVDAFAAFMTFLAPPPALPLSTDAKEGVQVFTRIGCTDCHTPTLTTGPNASAALDRQIFHPYSDFLLHDMGVLGDGITQNAATGRLMRTAPLWGVRTQTRLLHDGRAASVTDAVRAHDGQGAAARQAFDALGTGQRRKLLAFIATL
jgi:CxxC motif-containing protein (DUF1111 family)